MALMMNLFFCYFILVLLCLCLSDRLLTTAPLLASVSAFSSATKYPAFKTITKTTTYHHQHRKQQQQQQLLQVLSPSTPSTTTTTTSSTYHTTTTRTRLWASTLPDGYEEYGTAIIRKAAQDCGSTNVDDDITIEWKPGKIIVTVNTQNAYLTAASSSSSSSSSSENEDDEDDEDEDNLEFDIDDNDDNFLDNDEDDMLPTTTTTTTTTTEGDNGDGDSDGGSDSIGGGGIDVTKLARAINYGLDHEGDENSIGYKIAENHEIEVTTPIRSSSNELTNRIMFNAYKGFDVQCEFQDLKTKKTKTINGRLHDRTPDFTIINIRGRMKKIKNNQVLSVKLPKAKKEKGGGK